MRYRALHLAIILTAAPLLSSATARAERWVFDRPIEIPAGEQRLISVDEIHFTSKATIFLEGRLTLAARKISAEPGAAILTAQVGKAPIGLADGLPGASGGLLMLYVSEGFTGTLRVDLSGQSGGDGAAGDPGRPGVPGTPGHVIPFSFPIPQRCIFRGSAGGPGSPGQKGGNGGKGGDGGHVAVWLGKSASAESGLQIAQPHGGAAGLGGHGGAGGAGGGAPAGNPPQCSPSPGAGPTGTPGQAGMPGAPGNDGKLDKRVLSPREVRSLIHAL